MMEIAVNSSKKITVNSNQGSKCDLSFNVENRTSGKVVIFLEGKGKLNVRMNVNVGNDSHITFLTVNNVENEVVFNEKFDIHGDSEVKVAHAEFSDFKAEYNCDYQLLEQGADLSVYTASLSTSRKNFNQDTNHAVGNTKAHINNYGVVMANGYTDLIVRNTITKGAHTSSTHQTSRLLTYDKTAVGKILPVLYIYDNEVEASHAASLGQPDEEQIYYLQSRGLTHKEAIGLIVKGYLLPVTQIIEDESIAAVLQEEIDKKVK